MGKNKEKINQTAMPPSHDHDHSLDDSERVGSITFFLALALLTLAAGFVAAPVLLPLILAAISAGLSVPLKLKIDRLFSKRRRLSAAVTLLIMVVVVLAPLLIVGFFTVSTLVNLLTQATEDSAPISEMLRDGLEHLSAGSLGFLFGDDGMVSIDQVIGFIKQTLGTLSETLTQFIANIPRFMIMLLIYLYSLYFFILDGPKLFLQASSAIPLRGNEKQEFSATFLRVSRATLKSTFLIGGLQGVIGGIVFWILGLPAPLVFGVLFAMLAAIPNFGAILVWLPATTILFFEGETGRAVLMLIFGGGLVAAVDYLVRPFIIQDDAQLHQVLALAGIVGGLALFGLAGLLLGPIIMSLFVASWKTFRGRYRGELMDVANGKT